MGNGDRCRLAGEAGRRTCEEFGYGLVLPAGGADEQQPGGQELVVTGEELGDGPGRTGGGPLVPLRELAALVDGVHEQEEGLLRGLHAQERQQDAPEKRGADEKRSKIISTLMFVVVQFVVF